MIKRGSKLKDLGKIKGFSIQFIPYSEIKDLASSERIKRILRIVLDNHIIILQGKLRPEEEAGLIGGTMAMIEHIKDFKGVELAVLDGDSNNGILNKAKKGIANMLIGDTSSITIIGPATIVKEMKRNPKKIELLLSK